MRSFKIKDKSGEYKVKTRGRYKGITSEKMLVAALQKTCDNYKTMKGWKKHGVKCQELLDNRDYFELHRLWAIFG